MTLLNEIDRRRRASRATVERATYEVSLPVIALLTTTLVFLHAFLAALVRFQYHQEVSCILVAKDAAPGFPILALLLYMWHPLKGRSQYLACIASAAIGCSLVWLANEEEYYASMRMAPPLGTLWVWLFIELEWYLGAASFLAVLGYTWYNEYRF